MKISGLAIRNYRTLERLDLQFPSYYTAICGKNDSGKTNVVRALRCVMKEDDPFVFTREPEFSMKSDFTKWVSAGGSDRTISVSVALSIDPQRDAGLYAFSTDYLKLQRPSGELALTIAVQHKADAPQAVSVSVDDQTFTDIRAQEVLKKLQTSRTFLFHSSTEPRFPYQRTPGGVLRDISYEHTGKLEKAMKSVNGVMKKITKGQQQEIEGLIGRLNDKYRVGLACPPFDLSYFPYNLTLGDRHVEVALDDWGSGTRNRTLILLTIVKAKQVSESGASASKVTPVIVIEEPESFLHPLAQAEFGRVLQDLSEEFRVQIVVTTHSPYLLSQARPESNVLLERHRVRGQARHTERADTSGDDWMKPFALSLGITSDEFRSWRELFFTGSKALLLVEGDIDKEYFTILRDTAHGDNRLDFDGDIFPYQGKDSLKNQTLLRFIKNRFNKIFVTFDLDAEGEVQHTLHALGFEKKKTYLPIGHCDAGKKNIEGLLPDALVSAVSAANPDLIRILSSGSSDEKKNAKSRLKSLVLEKFKAEAKTGAEYYGMFYPVVKIINKALR